MEANLVERDGVKATVKVTVPAAEVDAAFGAVLRQLARQVKVPGFRPGRAPEGVLVKRIGAEALAQEVRDALVDENYPKAVRQLGLTPVHAHFHSDAPEKGAPFAFEVHVDLYPDFELPDLDQIVIDTEIPAVTDEMVERTVERLRRENATLVPVDRPSQPGDTVVLETVPETAHDAEGAEPGSQMPVDLDAVDEALAEQLLGRAIGEVVVLALDGAPAVDAEDAADDAPDAAAEDEAEGPAHDAAEDETADAAEDAPSAAADAPDDDGDAPAGEAASEPRTMRVRVANVQEKDLPDADDDLAKTLGFDTWEDAAAQIRASIGAQLERDAFEEQREEFVDKLAAETDFDLPPSLVSRRKAHLLESLADDLAQRGHTLEAYLTDLEDKGEREAFDAELTEAAERGVRRDILLDRLLEARGTTVSDAELQQALRHLAAREGKDVQRFRRERDDAWLENYRFLLARDKAVREVVREITGRADPAPLEAPAPATGAGAPEDDDEVVDAGSAPPPGSAVDGA